MIYQKLYFVVIVRVIGLLVNCLLLALAWVHYNDLLIIVNLLIILGLQTILFIRKLNRVNQDLENFFKAVRNNDSSMTFQSKHSKSGYDQLFQQFDFINKGIQEIKIDNENKNQYFKVLVEHVGVGLISYDEKGRVSLFNRAAKELFNITHLFHIQQLDRMQEGISALVLALQPSEQKLISFYRNHEMIQLSVKSTELKLLDENVTLVSFQNIKNELDEKELDSWQKLIRVLTHEIMNSVSPMSSSISTLLELYKDEKQKGVVHPVTIDSEIVKDTLLGLEIIDDRTKGMINFVTRFRDLTLLPKPDFEMVNLVERVKNLSKLFSERIKSEKVNFLTVYSEEVIEINGDPVLLDQILINLLTNSVQALKNTSDKTICISIGRNELERAFIDVKDNGCGVEKSLQSEIFVPFFTTKQNGSGIGLSLSRQLMRLHGGTITFKSEPYVQTQFRLQF